MAHLAIKASWMAPPEIRLAAASRILAIVAALETHKAEPAMDIFQKLDSLVRRSLMWQREPRDGGIDLRQTMRSAARDVRVALRVKAETRSVMGMFGQKNRDQN